MGGWAPRAQSTAGEGRGVAGSGKQGAAGQTGDDRLLGWTRVSHVKLATQREATGARRGAPAGGRARSTARHARNPDHRLTGAFTGWCGGAPHPHLILPGEGLVRRAPGPLLAVFQGGQQPPGPPPGVGCLLLILHTQAALGVLGGWRSCGSTSVGPALAEGASQVPPTGCSGHQAQFATSLRKQLPGPAMPPGYTHLRVSA